MPVQYIARIACDNCGATIDTVAEAELDNSRSYGWSGCDCKAVLSCDAWAVGWGGPGPNGDGQGFECPTCTEKRLA